MGKREREQEGSTRGDSQVLDMGRGPGNSRNERGASDTLQRAGERGYASASSELYRYGNERVVHR